MATKQSITDQRMMQLMDWAVQQGIATSEADFCEQIQFSRTNLRNIRVGHQSFNVHHIMNACRLTGASADYIFGFTNTRLRKQPKQAIDALREAVSAIDLELKRK